jgi:NHL repeat
VWGKQGWGPGEFDWVHGIVVDSKGAVYAADTYGQRIQKFVQSGTSSTQQ